VLLSLSLSQLCFMLPRDQCKFRIWDYEYISFILFYIRKISFNFISFVELCFSLVLLFFCSVLFKALIFFFISSPFYFNFCLFSIFFRWEGPASDASKHRGLTLSLQVGTSSLHVEQQSRGWFWSKTFLLLQLSTKVMTSKNSRMVGPLIMSFWIFRGFLPGKSNFFFLLLKYFFCFVFGFLGSSS